MDFFLPLFSGTRNHAIKTSGILSAGQVALSLSCYNVAMPILRYQESGEVAFYDADTHEISWEFPGEAPFEDADHSDNTIQKAFRKVRFKMLIYDYPS